MSESDNAAKTMAETTMPSLRNFELLEILSNDARSKKIVLLGRFKDADGHADEKKSIIFVERKEFTLNSFTTDDEEEAFLKHVDLETVLVNDIYSDFIGIPKQKKFNELKVTSIYPATDDHVRKYSMQNFFLVKETPEMYKNIIFPHLGRQQFSIDWIYNILEGKTEVDRVDFADLDPTNGFIFVKDYKWNSQVESLHLTALVMKRDIKSIRDLNSTHLPLLENIREKCFATIKTKYGLEENQVRAYLHYQPSYYHLHVHFTNLKFDAPGIFTDRAHLLSTVIDNIEMMPDYYQKSTITFAVGEKSQLYEAIKAATQGPQEADDPK